MPRIKIFSCARFKYFWLPIIIAIWTILQSMAHAWWVYFGRAMLACQVQVKRKLEFYLYMTYLYSNECDNNALSRYARLKFDATNTSSSLGLERMFKSDGTLTESLMNLYLGSDAIWIITSVALLIGIVMKLKQGSVLTFYLPWIIVTLTILAMDMFCALYYALQLPTAEIIQTFTWKLEKSTVMAIVSARLGVIWVINMSNLIYIIWYTCATAKQRYSEERRRKKPKMRRQETENRIKNWTLFYGEIDDTATSAATTHLPTNQKSSFIDEEELNYTTTFKELEDYNHKRRKFEGSVVDNEQELCSTFKSSSSSSIPVSTISTTALATVPSTSMHQHNLEAKKKVQITELVSHLPWSYIERNKKLPPALSPEASGTKTSRVRSDNLEEHLVPRPRRVVVMEPVKNLTTCDRENEQVSRF